MIRRDSLVRLLGAVLFVAAVTYPLTSAATTLETSIDLNYTYEQDRLGDDILDETTFSQKYLLEYESKVTSILDILAKIRVDYEEKSGARAADSSELAPSLEVGITGERFDLLFSYDATKDKTEQFEDNSGSTVYDNSALLTLEIKPLYLPEVKINLSRGRNFEEQQRERVDRTFELTVKKDADDLQFEFDFGYSNDESKLPSQNEQNDWAWKTNLSYKSVLWWDVDTELVYEINEEYTETFKQGVLTSEEEAYVQKIQARLQKSLVLTPRLTADLEYEYEFNQDILRIEEDYSLNQDLGLVVDYSVMRWLDAKAEFKRETEELVHIFPDETEETLDDTVTLSFRARPVKSIEVRGKADWEFARTIDADTGASVEDDTSATYEVDLKHRIGRWWNLTVAASSEYEWEDEWLTKEEGALKAALKLALFYDIRLDTTYEIERLNEFDAFEPLSFDQSKEEDLQVGFSWEKDFTSLISFAVRHDFGWTRERELDEVLNFEETLTISEDTELGLKLTDFIRGMTLDGRVTRNASDTKDDEEPLLVDILYELAWSWEIRELTLGAQFAYEDSGESFDEASLRTDVAWRYENIDVSGEYQIDKTYTNEVDENRKANLSMKVKF